MQLAQDEGPAQTDGQECAPLPLGVDIDGTSIAQLTTDFRMTLNLGSGSVSKDYSARTVRKGATPPLLRNGAGARFACPLPDLFLVRGSSK